jgi:hypothetical protein
MTESQGEPQARPPSAPAPRPAARSTAWAWYFVLVIVASVGVAGFMIYYNLRLQLKPEQLAAAQQKWKDAGPRDYRMVYSKRLNDEVREDRFVVTVRGGQVQEVLMNGVPLEGDARLYHTMDRLLADIQRFLDQDARPGAPRTYTTASFYDDTGGLRRFIRRVMGGQQRVELNVNKLDALPRDQDAPQAPG